jgi:hypothetical protein
MPRDKGERERVLFICCLETDSSIVSTVPTPVRPALEREREKWYHIIGMDTKLRLIGIKNHYRHPHNSSDFDQRQMNNT